MVTNLAILKRLAAAAAGSVRAEGRDPSPDARKAVDEMLLGMKTIDEVRQELLVRYQVKAAR
ncbi:MAG: hypothetical protein LBR32_01700 [Propionibacteriaceae bacterium]|jgi:hypothetical protein|nr:hypothetical protein [Propionibacteriaceae bacterium]